MAYSGYLIKVGNYEIPMNFIIANTYDVTRNVMEASAYRDANGLLHRNTISHVPLKVNFQTPSDMTNEQVQLH